LQPKNNLDLHISISFRFLEPYFCSKQRISLIFTQKTTHLCTSERTFVLFLMAEYNQLCGKEFFCSLSRLASILEYI
jgi:hypothetical protein